MLCCGDSLRIREEDGVNTDTQKIAGSVQSLRVSIGIIIFRFRSLIKVAMHRIIVADSVHQRGRQHVELILPSTKPRRLHRIPRQNPTTPHNPSHFTLSPNRCRQPATLACQLSFPGANPPCQLSLPDRPASLSLPSCISIFPILIISNLFSPVSQKPTMMLIILATDSHSPFCIQFLFSTTLQDKTINQAKHLPR